MFALMVGGSSRLVLHVEFYSVARLHIIPSSDFGFIFSVYSIGFILFGTLYSRCTFEALSFLPAALGAENGRLR